MFTSTNPIYRRALAWLAAILATASLVVVNENAVAENQPTYTQPELDRMLAPIALYPDPLLSQIVMASTYPIEVVEAARWSRANPGLQGDTAVRAVESQDWDPSVKSLVAFPDVLARMDENLAWTRQLGDAFLAQEPQVMETVQRLRQRAREAGTLVTDPRIIVVDSGHTIVVQPADPRVIYVPYYDPRLAYGTWWWPAYPPVVWAPWPGYAAHYPQTRPGVAVGFFWGPAVRISVGFFFGAIDWPRREVRVVSVDNYYYRPAIVRRDVHVTQVNVAPGPWRHDPWHSRGAVYQGPDMQRRVAPTAPPHVAPRAEQPRPAAALPRPGSNTPTTRPAAKASPIAHDAPRREVKEAPSRPTSASPDRGAPSPTASAAPIPRESRSDTARDTPGPRAGRTDARAPAVREEPQRAAESARTQRDPRTPTEGMSRQPRPPSKDEHERDQQG